MQTLPALEKQDFTTPSLQQLLALASDLSKVTCFNYSDVSYFANSCPELQTFLQIYEISQDTKASSSEALNEDIDSELEN